MPGPGEYRADPTVGIGRVEDLPQPKIACRSRNYRRRPCPRCGSPIRIEAQGALARLTYYCDRCQGSHPSRARTARQMLH